MNHYQTLGIKQTADIGEIKKAYRTLAKKYHPDKNLGDETASKKFVEIAQAYEILSDEKTRATYDKTLGNFNDSKGNAFDNNTNKGQTFNPKDIKVSKDDFENFFGFTMNNGKVEKVEKKKQKSVNPMDTSQIFKNFFGR